MIYYRQCFLQKESQSTTSWIPEQFAHLGNVIKLKNKNDGWDDGWKVVGIGIRQAEDLVLDNSQDYKRQRAASDI